MVNLHKRPHRDGDSRRPDTRAKRNRARALLAWRLSRDAVVRLPRFDPDGTIVGAELLIEGEDR